MALSFEQYIGDGTNVTFGVTFPYLDKDHIVVKVAAVEKTFTWDDDSTIRLPTAPAVGVVVDVRRHTPNTARLVDFNDGSVLTEKDLDLANIQTFYIVQEAIDIAGGTLGVTDDGSYVANGRRITQLGDPVNQTDVVNVRWAETSMSSNLGQAINARNAAQSAQTASEGARDLALQYRDAAIAARDAAIAAQGNSEAAQAAAEGARDLALQYRDAASASETAAATSETNAATSETNAAESETTAERWASEADDVTVVDASTGLDTGLFSAKHEANRAETYANSLNIPVNTGKSLQILRQKQDETGFEYVELATPVTTRQTCVTGPKDAEGRADFLTFTGSQVSTKDLDVTPLMFTIGAGLTVRGEKNFVGNLMSNVTWPSFGPCVGALGRWAFLYLDVDPATQAVSPVVGWNAPEYGVKVPFATPRLLTPDQDLWQSSDFSNLELWGETLGVATASSEYSSNFPPGKAFRREKTGSSNGWICDQTVPLPQWLAYRWGGEQRAVLSHYDVTCRDSGYPHDWTVEGSNDEGLTWTVLDTQTGITWATNFLTQRFTLPTQVAGWNMLRIHVTASSTNTSWVLSVQELGFFGHFEDEFFYCTDHDGLPLIPKADGTTEARHRIAVGEAFVNANGTVGSVISYAYNGRCTIPVFPVSSNTRYEKQTNIGTHRATAAIYYIEDGHAGYGPYRFPYRREVNMQYFYNGNNAGMGAYRWIERNKFVVNVAFNNVYHAKMSADGHFTNDGFYEAEVWRDF